MFDKLDAVLAQALMSVGAVKGVEIGDGFAAARSRGSFNNDAYRPAGAGSTPGNPATNHCGGILGGISTGQPLVMTVAIKPIPSIAKEQQSVNAEGSPVSLRVGGRHDICAIPRVNPVLEAMAALTVADALLLQRRMGSVSYTHLDVYKRQWTLWPEAISTTRQRGSLRARSTERAMG